MDHKDSLSTPSRNNLENMKNELNKHPHNLLTPRQAMRAQFVS